MIKRTIIYARVSTEDQVEKYGLPSQLRACREYAALNGLTIIEEITDDGITGTTMDRPGLERVRRMVREGACDVVLMFDADRLSRELAHLLILKPEIEKRAALEFVAAKFEDSPSGRMFFSIRGTIAQFEREQTRERTMRGNRERASAGLGAGGRIAYGYQCDAGKLTPDEPRAAIVRRIFAAYDSGLSTRAITRELREAGAPTWKGQPWGYSSVRRILMNETYAGVAYYGTHRRDGKILRLRERSERISMSVPALVDRALWLKVQGRMASNPLVGRPSTTCLLRGLLHCVCGRRMYGAKKDAYRCGGRDPLRVAPGTKACYRFVNLKKVDSAVWSALLATLTDAAVLRAALQRQESGLREATPERMTELRASALRWKRKEDAAVTAMLDPDLSASRDTIKTQYRAILGERRRVEAELATIEETQRASLSAREWLDETSELLREDLRTLTDQASRVEFVRRMVHRAEWNGKEIRMVCFICPQLRTTSPRSAQFDRLQVIVTAEVAA